MFQRCLVVALILITPRHTGEEVEEHHYSTHLHAENCRSQSNIRHQDSAFEATARAFKHCCCAISFAFSMTQDKLSALKEFPLKVERGHFIRNVVKSRLVRSGKIVIIPGVLDTFFQKKGHQSIWR